MVVFGLSGIRVLGCWDLQVSGIKVFAYSGIRVLWY